MVVTQVIFQRYEIFTSGTNHMLHIVVITVVRYFYRWGLKFWRKISHPSSSTYLLTQSLMHSLTQQIFLEGRKQLFGKRCMVASTWQPSLLPGLYQSSLWEQIAQCVHPSPFLILFFFAWIHVLTTFSAPLFLYEDKNPFNKCLWKPLPEV